MTRPLIILALLLMLAGCAVDLSADEPTETAATPTPVATVATTEEPEPSPSPAAEPTTEPEPTEDPLPTDGCNQLFAAEAALDPLEDTGEFLDDAIPVCESVDDWIAASEANPDALDGVDPEIYLANGCIYGEQEDQPICQDIISRCEELLQRGAAACLEITG